MANTETKHFWIYKLNLAQALLILSHIIKYKVGSYDLEAIKYGLTATSDKKNQWFTYQLIGEKTLDFRLSRDEGNTDIIFIQLSFDKELAQQIDLFIFIIQGFFIEHRDIHSDLDVYE